MLFDRRCASCGAPARSICRPCIGALHRASLVDAAPPRALRSALLSGSFTASFRYDPVVAKLLVTAKNGGRRDVLNRLARHLAVCLVPVVDRADGPTVIAWVPASIVKRRRRGYDQGQLIARVVARNLGLAVRPLLRRAGPRSQANRGRIERLAGPDVSATGASPSRVLLIDDVATTGGSLVAGVAALNRAGASVIDTAVIALVDDDRRR